jgi:outer membrane protein assembly factor BamE
MMPVDYDADRRPAPPPTIRMKFRFLSIVLAAWAATACVYRIDIQQGNLLDDEDIAQVEVGMTRSQVQFLLGTPMVADSFHRDRWDYPYYLRRGRSRDADRRWLVVYFENDRVARVDRNVELQPPS